MSRTTFYRDDDIRLSFEEINECLFIHVTFRKFTKSILTRLRKVWWEFQGRAYFDGWSEIFTYTKDERIVKLIGGANEVGMNDIDLMSSGYRMFKWELK